MQHLVVVVWYNERRRASGLDSWPLAPLHVQLQAPAGCSPHCAALPLAHSVSCRHHFSSLTVRRGEGSTKGAGR